MIDCKFIAERDGERILKIGQYFGEESRAVARKPRYAAAVLFGLMFADNIHYKFKSNQASKARLQSSKDTGAKQIFNAKWPFNFKVVQGHAFWSQW